MAIFTNTKGERIKTSRNTDGSLNREVLATDVKPRVSFESPAITSESIKPVPQLKISNPQPALEVEGLQGIVQAQQDAFTSDLEQKRKVAETNLKSSRDPLRDYINELQGQTALEDQLYSQKGGVDALQEELNDINAQIREEQLSQRRKTEAVLKTGGQSKGQAQSLINNINRDSIAKQADLSVIQMALQGKYDSAKSIADRAVSAKLEQQKINLESLWFDYEENKELFTVAEQRQFESAQSDRERKLNAEEAEMKQISDFSIEALKAGAPVSVASAIRSAKTMNEAIALGGGYLRPRPSVLPSVGNGEYTTPTGDTVKAPSFEEWIAAKENDALQTFSPATRESMRSAYEAEITLINQANALSRLSPTAREIVKNPKGYFDLTATRKGEILDELAKNGIDTAQIQNGKKRPLTATQADDFVQAQIARNGVIELKKKLDKLTATGPIVGGVRQLNPYDPQVVAIKAELTRIVPGLARGIYKEVGVLTDQDVARYMDTLANPTLTPEQREQIHNDTMSKIDQSISIASETYKDLGYDMGRFDATEITQTDNLTDEEAYSEYLKLTQ